MDSEAPTMSPLLIPADQIHRIKANNKYTLEGLLDIKPGTLLIAGETSSSEKIKYPIYGHSDQDMSDMSSIGFQWFDIGDIRVKNFYICKSPEEVLLLSKTYDHKVVYNLHCYNSMFMDFYTDHKMVDQPLGMVLGEYIVGMSGASEQVLLMKLFMTNHIGWICFYMSPKHQRLLELQ
jgi:hypothetical protein